MLSMPLSRLILGVEAVVEVDEVGVALEAALRLEGVEEGGHEVGPGDVHGVDGVDVGREGGEAREVVRGGLAVRARGAVRSPGTDQAVSRDNSFVGLASGS